MHLNEIRATAFGPFRGASLELAPGMNVIHGPNEAGKSSWFAAAYAGLAGRRKARGRGTVAQADFRNRHKPWSGAQWSAGVTLTLDDGLVLALEHDLAKGEFRVVDSYAGRVVPVPELAKRLGIDLTTESTLDGTRLLGLNRDSARATIFTGQADVLRVLDDAGELQEFLERAATSEVADATAEGALAWLAEVRSERVGSEHLGRKPLRARAEQVAGAREATSERRDQLVRLIETISERRSMEGQLRKAKDDVELVDRIDSWSDIRSVQNRVRQAQTLSTQLDASAHVAEVIDEDRIREATMILGAYDAGTDVDPLPEGADAADLRAEIDALPDSPVGDLEPRQEVLDAREHLTSTAAALDAHVHGAPALGPAVGIVSLEADELRMLADSLEVGPPTLKPGLVEELETAQRADEMAATRYAEAISAYEAASQSNDDRRRAHAEAVAEHARLIGEFQTAQTEYVDRQAAARTAAEEVVASKKKRGNLIAAGGALLMLVGVVLTLVGSVVPGIALAIVGAVVIASGLLTGRAQPPAHSVAGGDVGKPLLIQPRVPEPLQLEKIAAPAMPMVNPQVMELRVALQTQENAVRQQSDNASADRARLAEHSLEADPAVLRKLARSIDDAQDAEERRHRHQDQEQALRSKRDTAALALASVLGEQIDAPVTDEDLTRLIAAMDAYVVACRGRAVTAQIAGRREDLTAALMQRQQLESDRTTAAVERERQSSAVLDLVRGLVGDAAADVVSLATAAPRLRSWLEDQRRLRSEHVVASELAARLDQMLESRSLVEWQRELAELIEAAGPEPEDIPVDVEALRAQAAQRYERVVGRAGALAGAQEQLSRDLASVAQAIEDEAVAERALAEVQSLRTCIDAAVAQLNLAKDRAHANIAPALEARVRPLLPQVTEGRYLDVMVDPSDLTLKVTEASGAVREARLLSQGTMEQIFLLLRIALSQVLSGGQESAPLILDDVTVQSDLRRTTAILTMLHTLSADHQVVLFTQEQEVVDWASANLLVERDRVIAL